MNNIQYPKTYCMRKRTPDGKQLRMDSYSNPAFQLAESWPLSSWILTEKIDGTNIRVIFDEYGSVEFRGRTDKAELHKDLVKHLTETFVEHDENGDPEYSGVSDLKLTASYSGSFGSIGQDLTPRLKAKEKFKPYRECIFFGEGFGAGIQKAGINYSPTKSFIMFDIWHDNDTTQGQWYEFQTMQTVAEELEIPVVGTYDYEEDLELDMRHDYENDITDIERLFQDWTPDSKFGDFESEGFVVRPIWNLFDSRGGRIKMKIKARDYKLPMV